MEARKHLRSASSIQSVHASTRAAVYVELYFFLRDNRTPDYRARSTARSTSSGVQSLPRKRRCTVPSGPMTAVVRL